MPLAQHCPFDDEGAAFGQCVEPFARACPQLFTVPRVTVQGLTGSPYLSSNSLMTVTELLGSARACETSRQSVLPPSHRTGRDQSKANGLPRDCVQTWLA
jgi:hypothetical protein